MKGLKLTAESLADQFDSLLDKLTTYRLVLYSLIAYLLAGIVLNLDNQTSFPAWQIAASAAWLLVVCRLSNVGFSRLFKIPANHESDLITGLILALILTPAAHPRDYLVVSAAGAAAMLSKYVITINHRHLLNPAAFGAFVSGRLLHDYPSWWVSSRSMAPLLIIGGVLILRKMRRFQMVATFMATYLVVLLVNSHFSISGHLIWIALIATPLIFFSSVMLTEPMTSPSKFRLSLIYAFVIGLIYSITRLRLAPEEALLIGNLLTFALLPSRNLMLSFAGHTKEADGIYSFWFKTPKKLAFTAGQYMEWTMPGVNFDARGNRRYLTIASSPTEDGLMFTIKIPEPASSFKNHLLHLRPGSQMLASTVAGAFTLPRQTNKKLVWMAGGVGITPFRSMAKYLLDSNQHQDVKLLYFVNNEDEAAFKDLFARAEAVGLRTDYVVGRHLDSEFLKKSVPDWRQRQFYVSGPQGFVAAARQILISLGIAQDQIHTDYFPGYGT